MDHRSKVKAGIYVGIISAFFFMLQDLLTRDDLTTKNIIIIIVSSLVGGALGGLLFGWLLGLFINSNFLKKGTSIVTDKNETIVFETGANHFKGVEGVGGKLYLTNKRLVFKSHNFNIQKHELSISLSDVDQVARYSTFGIVNNGLSVTTSDNVIEKFAVQQPEEWMNQLTEKNSLQQVHLQ
jgi:hypothetical protein